MPVTKSAKKALRKDRRRTIINKQIKRRLKEAIKAFRKKPSNKSYALVSSLLDRTAKKKVIPKNKAARLKSRLACLLSKVRAKAQKLPAKSVSKIKKRVAKAVNH